MEEKYRPGAFRQRMITISFITASIGAVLFAVYIFVLIEPTQEELETLGILVFPILPLLLAGYILLLIRLAKPVEDFISGRIEKTEKAYRDIYHYTLLFPIKATILAVLSWAIGAVLISLSAFIIMKITLTDSIYIFIGVIAGGTIGPLLAFYYFKKYTLPVLEAIVAETGTIESYLNGNILFALRTKLLLAFVVLLTVSLGLAGLMEYEKSAKIIQRKSSDYALIELRRIQEIFKDKVFPLTDTAFIEELESGYKNQWGFSIISKNGGHAYGSSKLALYPHEIEIIGKSTYPDRIFRRTKDVIAYTPLGDGAHYAVFNLKWSRIGKEARVLARVSLALILITLIICSFLAFLISDDVAGYIKKMSSVAQGISRGELNQKIPVPTEDEVGVLADSLKVMGVNLLGIVQRINRASNRVNEAVSSIVRSSSFVSESSAPQNETIELVFKSISDVKATVAGLSESASILANSVSESTASMLGLSVAIQDVSKRMEFIADSVNQSAASAEQMAITAVQVSTKIDELSVSTIKTASAVSQIDSSIKGIEENAGEAKKLSEKVRSYAEDGAKAVVKSIEAIKEIAKGSQRLADEIDSLKRRTVDVSRILTVIEDITEETNLLALNAAIIAAQAGEHGRGFAVVADEIRDLAERTSNSTKEIADIIKKVNEDSGRATQVMDEQKVRITSGVELAVRSGEVLNKILSSSEVASGRIANIAQTTSELSKVSKEVSREIERVAQAVKESAAALRTQAQSCETIAVVSDKIRKAILEIKAGIKEQEKGSNNIAQNTQNIEELGRYLDRAVKEHDEKSREILKEVEMIRNISHDNIQKANELKEVIGILEEEARLLGVEVKRFKY